MAGFPVYENILEDGLITKYQPLKCGLKKGHGEMRMLQNFQKKFQTVALDISFSNMGADPPLDPLLQSTIMLQCYRAQNRNNN